MEIAQGGSGDVKYDVSFVGGKLVAKVADDKLGMSDAFSVDGTLVADALVDLIEKGIPGDQTAVATLLKGLINSALAAQV